VEKIHVRQEIATLVGSCEIGSKSTSSVNVWEFLDDMGDDVFSLNVCIVHLVIKTITLLWFPQTYVCFLCSGKPIKKQSSCGVQFQVLLAGYFLHHVTCRFWMHQLLRFISANNWKRLLRLLREANDDNSV